MENTDSLLKKLDRKNMPRHVAIIMDGNGRWAKERGLPRIAGHSKGVESAKKIVRFIGKNLPEIKVLTLYVFSTENWSRPLEEVRGLMGMISKYLVPEIPKLDKNNVCLRWIGRSSFLPRRVKAVLERSVWTLSKNTGLVLNLAINYGGRAEILDAIRRVIRKVADGELDAEKLDETGFEKFLYTGGLPPPDLLIRTGGEMRISNFLLWQVAYTELYFTAVYWPLFTPRHFLEAILDYQRRHRRFGTIENKVKLGEAVC